MYVYLHVCTCACMCVCVEDGPRDLYNALSCQFRRREPYCQRIWWVIVFTVKGGSKEKNPGESFNREIIKSLRLPPR